MKSSGIRIVLSAIICGFFLTNTRAQMRPPGYEREVKQMEARKLTSILDTDSVTVVDTVTYFDPDTYIDSTMYVKSNLSWRDYMQLRVGVINPDELLNGQPKEVTNLKTYEKIVVQWNAAQTRLDTIPPKQN